VNTARSKGEIVERTVRTPDGRTLTVEESGDLAGRPVLVHMGAPNSRHLYGPNVADAAARGLRLIGYDRPGYGGSSPQPGRTVANCAGDVRAICAELGIDRLAMWGIAP
jgi:pimeloyl-ACP methyl ester carboxylesterase